MSIHDQNTAVTDVHRTVPAPEVSDCLVIIYQKEPAQQGKRILLDALPMRIGREIDNDIVLEDSGVSRTHARIERLGNDVVVMDVGSTNGTLLNEHELDGAVSLKNGDRLKIGSTIFKYLSGSDVEAAFHEEIYQIAIMDNLTQLHSRRYLDNELAREFSRARRHGRSLGILLLDIDHFKHVNDRYGHLAGDMVLREISDIVRSRFRTNDIIARYGGEEIVIVMPETSLVEAMMVAEDVRAAVAAHVTVFREHSIAVTVSIGCAELQQSDAAVDDLIQRCDERLYAAKRTGRNRVVGDSRPA